MVTQSAEPVMELPTVAGPVLFVHAEFFIVWETERATL
jgi:hypothetical protein